MNYFTIAQPFVCVCVCVCVLCVCVCVGACVRVGVGACLCLFVYCLGIVTVLIFNVRTGWAVCFDGWCANGA